MIHTDIVQVRRHDPTITTSRLFSPKQKKTKKNVLSVRSMGTEYRYGVTPYSNGNDETWIYNKVVGYFITDIYLSVKVPIIPRFEERKKKRYPYVPEDVIFVHFKLYCQGKLHLVSAHIHYIHTLIACSCMRH